MITISRLCTVIALAVFLIFVSVPCLGKPAASGTNSFVDLDGDGFNDSETDGNGNNIPDRFEPQKKSNEPAVRSLLGNVFNSEKVSTNLDDLLSNADKFGSRMFGARALPQRCHGFSLGDEFGAASGIGGASGGCVGGACTR